MPGLTRAALNDHRLGHILDALFAANLNGVFSTGIAFQSLWKRQCDSRNEHPDRLYDWASRICVKKL
jgi:hypothetical protein